MSRRVSSVLVVGRDAAAFVAALAICRSLGRTGVRVQLLELPSLLKPVDVYAGLPALHGLNRMLGLEEADVLAACAGVPVMAQRFSNWGRGRRPFLIGYDTPATSGGNAGFFQYWLKAKGEGLRVELEDFSLAAAAAKQGRVPSDHLPAGPVSAAPGYHLDASSYVALLRRAALQEGVEIVSGTIGAVSAGDHGIEQIALKDGRRMGADLYVDATGADATLIGALGSDFTSWAEWLPCDRILAASGKKLSPLPAFSEISAFKGGWVGLHPLQDRTALVACYASRDCPDAETSELLPIVAGIALDQDAFVTPFRTGIRQRPWVANCVALGDSAVALEPLSAVQLHLIHLAVSHLITLFPADAGNMMEAVAYTRLMHSHAVNLRDFQAAHYKLNRRYDEPFWDRVRQAAGPESLEEKIRLFAARGMIPLREDETFQEESWTALLAGHGVAPRGYDPRVDLLSQQQHMETIQQRLRAIGDQVRAMPTVEASLAGVAARQDSA
ncbi:hypothetical protein E2493_06900 [Sphingomonas parva]|uniref:Tryptophan 7-halogenase n=1 Tax=Sphingomonas parva TaxID=2555898 RepID=A0A4Y8ZWW1_9SPHN|nr:tryptophan 7-halogenase [Sphingomonas parva]TFI58976.1 hypothetical protein E2493_06900 [Sphingomonas parva]